MPRSPLPGAHAGAGATVGPASGQGLLVAALEAVDQAVCVADVTAPDEPLVYVNPAFTRTTGYPAADALGRNCRFLQDGLDVGDAPARIRALLRAGASGVVTLPNRRADGAVFSNELSLSPLRDAEGRVTHYVAVQRDVTAQVEAERARDVLRAEQAEIADQLQRTLVPASLPQLAGCRTAVRYSPATRPDGSRGEVSGDVYDVLPRPGGGWYAFIGDVSGRGPRAAATTGVLRWALRGAAAGERRPGPLLREVGGVVRDAMDGRFATLALVALPAADGGVDGGGALEDEVVVALAGHPRPVLLPAEGPPRLVGRHGSLLGLLPEVVVHEERVALRQGDQLVLYTDGVTEAMDASRTMLGEDGLLAALAALPPASRRGPGTAGRTADAVLAAVERHTGGAGSDDLTLLVLARDGDG
ncbi:SpoIIE family protein phosphatase [Pseudokineococcus marinus]|uniref:SpoIIE family protein phosphatase n=1 Tax=Pseudokineococcus marinus TaxID=351215 RepID=A0A849BII7_9ACTN|nr:PP2C family protein-serine/threonine phosphatase [Pseudokineococcus marinus]NNH22990.1 SpoIIE family protein phosphatase [Pseudokineococcus marinus]